MNWEAIGAIGEIIGALAVVVTLVYLSAQMRTNTAAINRTANQSVILGRGESARFLASDEKFAQILWSGADDPDSLSKEDWRRLCLLVNAIVRPVELAYLDYCDGRLDEDTWKGQDETLAYWFPKPGYQRWLQEFGQTMHPNFLEYIISKHSGDSGT